MRPPGCVPASRTVGATHPVQQTDKLRATSSCMIDELQIHTEGEEELFLKVGRHFSPRRHSINQRVATVGSVASVTKLFHSCLLPFRKSSLVPLLLPWKFDNQNGMSSWSLKGGYAV